MKSELRSSILVSVAALTSILISVLTAYAVAETASDTLAAPESFSSIGDINKRSAALFTELGTVLTNPRCVNCHPAGDRPSQGDLSRVHQPPVYRGPDGFGLETMRCPVCHQSANFEPGRMPGHSQWHLAPLEMGWEGKDDQGDLCADQGSCAQRWPFPGGPHTPHWHRHFDWLGLGARVWPTARSGNPEGSWRLS